VRADSVANRVYIESHNVREAYVLLNDALVDLEKPVTFVVNGVAHNQLFSRSVETVFEYLIRYYDCTALYSVRYQFLLPRQPSAPNDLARGGRSPRTSVKFPPEAVSSVEDPVNPRSVIPWETLAVATGLGCVMIVIVVMIYRRRRGSSRTIG
jgi:hypothetical protein